MALLDSMQDPGRWQRLLQDLMSSGVSVDPSQSGGFNPRNIAGTNTPSQHSFGRAMDVNWRDNPRGSNPAGGGMDDPTRQFNVIRPDVAREVAGRHGMTWGGDWANPDPMHFEMNRTGPTPLANRSLIAQAGLTSPGAPPVHPPTAPPAAPLGAQGLLASSGPTSGEVAPQAMPHTSQPAQAPFGAPGGFLDRLMVNPAFMAGLSILGTAPGGNWGPAGAQAASNTIQSRIRQSDFERQQAQREQTQRIWGEAFPNGQANPNHALTRGVPPELLAAVHAMGPEAGLTVLGKLAMTRSTAQMKADLERQQRQQQIGDLERLFAGQGGQQPGAQPPSQQAPAAQPDPFAAPATVVPPGEMAGPGLAAGPGAGPPAVSLPSPTGGQPPQAPQQPPQQSGLPPILNTPGVRESMIGSMLLGDSKGAFDAYNAEVGRRRAPQVAGETTRANERAKLDVARPQARASVTNTMDGLGRMEAEARAIHDDPALSRITGLSGQFGDFPGGAAADTRARLKSLVSQIGFSTLQAMREASKTGGALGSVSERELEALQNAIAGLDTKQSTESFQRALQQVMDYSRKARGRLTTAYRDTYGEDFGEVPPPKVFPTRPETKKLGKKTYMKIDGQWFEQ